MKVAGVILGAIALVGVFEDCVELICQIGAAKSMEKDYIRLETKLDFQKTLLLQWATRLNLFEEQGYDTRHSRCPYAKGDPTCFDRRQQRPCRDD
jgi:hypothetical protein